MTDRAHSKETTALAPTTPEPRETEESPEALAHAVRDHRRAVEETVEALKSKLTRASDKVEHARERVGETTERIREHRWPVLGAVTILGLYLGTRRRYAPPPVQLMLPSGYGEAIKKEEKKRTLVQTALATIGGLLLREIGMRAVAVLEEKLLRASNPPEPPLH